MPLPIVPDSDHIHPLAMDYKFTAYVGLNPQQLLICKHDCTPFNCDNVGDIDETFIKSTLNDLIKMNQDNNEYFNDFEIDDYFTGDCIYYVMNLSIKIEKRKDEFKEEAKEEVKKEVKKEVNEQSKEKTEKKGIRYLLSLIRKK